MDFIITVAEDIIEHNYDLFNDILYGNRVLPGLRFQRLIQSEPITFAGVIIDRTSTEMVLADNLDDKNIELKMNKDVSFIMYQALLKNIIVFEEQAVLRFAFKELFIIQGRA